MKNIFLGIIIYTGFLVPFSKVYTQDIQTEKKILSVPEELGLVIFISLKTDDFTEFSKYIAGKDDMKWIITRKNFSSEEKKKAALDLLDDYEYTLKKDAKESFKNTLQKGIDNQIMWEETVYDKIDFNISTEEGLKYTDITIYFTFNKKKYKIYTEGCMKTDKGWKMFDKLKWGGPD